MPNKRKIESLTDKNKERILHTENKVNETYLLLILSFILLSSVFLIDIIFNVKAYPLLIISFIVVLSSSIFLFYKLQRAKMRIGAILTAEHNKIDIDQLDSYEEVYFEQMDLIILSWKYFKGYYILSVLIILLSTFIVSFMY
ncbi:hypothetical protein PZL33_10660 [Staphylococcus hominis]|uniref:hypothetical protein n=1 Tax=Staphylococcus hominis TaxID=1290 RepID=UPI002480DDA4|nr:hypothetical protein [Staphylococcus hominis]MDH9922347.1 hypothetical protein [Staphylococcus hominis]MDH9924644.1 hypothetical protein [Staphylococcus hominis]